MTIPEQQAEFVQYLRTDYTYAHPEEMASEVFYSKRHYIGIPFEDIFLNDDSIERARNLLISHFEKIGRKNPRNHASVHYSDWVKFKEFLDQQHPNK